MGALNRVVSGIKNLDRRRKVKKRLNRLVAADQRATESWKRRLELTHGHRQELSVHRAELERARTAYRRRGWELGFGTGLTATGLVPFGAPLAVRGSIGQSNAQERISRAQQGIKTTTETIMRSRITGETPEQRIRRRLAGKPKGKDY